MEFRANLSGADLDKLTAEAAKGLRAVQRTLGRDIARAASRAILDDVRTSRKGGLRFGRGRLATRSKIEPAGDRVDVTVSAAPAGAWSIVEHGSTAHEIVARRAKVLAFDGRFAFRVNHPGTVGRPFWAGAETALDRAVTPVVVDAFDEALGV